MLQPQQKRMPFLSGLGFCRYQNICHCEERSDEAISTQNEVILNILKPLIKLNVQIVEK